MADSSFVFFAEYPPKKKKKQTHLMKPKFIK